MTQFGDDTGGYDVVKSALWRDLLEELAMQRQCLDMMNSAWLSEYRLSGYTVYCARGCHNCCTLTVNCTLTEAVALAEQLTAPQRSANAAYTHKLLQVITSDMELKEYLKIQRTTMGSCPLLDENGACSVYSHRPLSCRSLFSTKESSWCGTDFSELSADLKQEYLASLDQRVVAFPTHYAASPQETARDLEQRQLQLMKVQFGFACYGCLPVLVYLVLEHGLAGAENRVHAEQIVRQSGCANPLLISWSS